MNDKELAAPQTFIRPEKWTLLLTGDNHGLVGAFGNKWEGHPEHYERVDVIAVDAASRCRAQGGNTSESASFATQPASPVPVNDVQGEREAAAKELRSALSELVGIVDGFVEDGCDGCGLIDSFTTQPAHRVLDGGKFEIAPSPVSVSERVPEEVRRALDRMCTPLHATRLLGVTAQEDARCMQIIKQHIEAAAPVPPAAPAGQVRDAAMEEAGYRSGRRVGLLEGATIARQLFMSHCHHHGAEELLNRCHEAADKLAELADEAMAIATPSTNGEQRDSEQKCVLRGWEGFPLCVGDVGECAKRGFCMERTASNGNSEGEKA